MLTKFHVSTIEDSQSATELKEHILTSEPDAKVNIDSKTKTVEIESEASAETFDELIVAAGHSIDGMEEVD